MEKKQKQVGSVFCVNHPSEPAKYYCLTCSQFLCLVCRQVHRAQGHNIDHCKSISQDMVADLLNSDKNVEHEPDIEKPMIEAAKKVRELFKWIETQTMGIIKEIYEANKKGKLTEKVKNQMASLNEQKKYAELYLLCLKFKDAKKKNERKFYMAKMSSLKSNLTGVISKFVEQFNKISERVSSKFL